MNWLYASLLLGSALPVILLSFDSKVAFSRRWKALLKALCLAAIPFLIWDIVFTHKGFWGFNPNYHFDLKLLGLPIEEILFFFVIPFACVFIYDCIKYWFHPPLKKHLLFGLTSLWLGIAVFLLMESNFKPYPLVNFVFLIPLIAYGIGRAPQIFYRALLAFCLVLIPFYLINGILTGSGIDDQVVWYADDAFSGLRIWTVPLEDAVYALDLFLLNVFLYERFH